MKHIRELAAPIGLAVIPLAIWIALAATHNTRASGWLVGSLLYGLVGVFAFFGLFGLPWRDRSEPAIAWHVWSVTFVVGIEGLVLLLVLYRVVLPWWAYPAVFMASGSMIWWRVGFIVIPRKKGPEL